jgi:fluoroacetyl-CoA thioesterase
MSSLTPGLRHTLTVTVDDALLVPAVFPARPSFGAMPPVLTTAFMIGLIELACVEALQPHLTPGQLTVGTHVDMSHCAATPAGMAVTAEVTLEAIEGRRLWFHVAARDQADLIGEGRHQRTIIDRARFMASVARKARLVA